MALFITILVAELLSDYLINQMLSFKKGYDPYLYTLAGMVILVVVYYPLMVWADKFLTRFSEKFLRVGKNIVGRRFGVFIMFAVAVGILFYIFMKEWYHVDLLRNISLVIL